MWIGATLDHLFKQSGTELRPFTKPRLRLWIQLPSPRLKPWACVRKERECEKHAQIVKTTMGQSQSFGFVKGLYLSEAAFALDFLGLVTWLRDSVNLHGFFGATLEHLSKPGVRELIWSKLHLHWTCHLTRGQCLFYCHGPWMCMILQSLCVTQETTAWFNLLKGWVLFVVHKTQCQQIYDKLTQFKDNDGIKHPLKYYLLLLR